MVMVSKVVVGTAGFILMLILNTIDQTIVLASGSEDDILPTLAITEPEFGSKHPLGSVLVRGLADDGSGIRDVYVKVDDGGTYQKATPKATGDWSEWSITFSITTTGDHRIIARATDNAGNQKWANIPISIGSQKIITVCSECSYGDIQTAIDALPVHGGIIKVKAGTYTLDTAIKLRSNVEIQGEGSDIVILQRISGYREIFSGYYVSNVRISGLTADGMQNPTDNNGLSIVVFTDSAGITLHQLVIKNSDKMGILLKRTNDATVSESSISNVWTGLSIQSSSNINIHENHVNYTIGDGIYITNDWYQETDYSSSNVVVKDNVLEMIADTGIDSSVTSPKYTNRDILIQDNYYKDSLVSSIATANNQIGITISRTRDVSVMGNTIDNCDRGIFVGHAVENSDGTEVPISNNAIQNFKNFGVVLLSSGVVVTDNIIDGADAGGPIGIAIGEIEEAGTIDSNIIRGTVHRIAWIK